MEASESPSFHQFFDLPLEIRRNIYHLLFSETNIVYDFNPGYPVIRHYTETYQTNVPVSDKQQNAFLRVSKRCYLESVQIYFTMSHVIFDSAWKVTAKNLDQLKMLRLYVTDLELNNPWFSPGRPWSLFTSLLRVVAIDEVERARKLIRFEGTDRMAEVYSVLDDNTHEFQPYAETPSPGFKKLRVMFQEDVNVFVKFSRQAVFSDTSIQCPHGSIEMWQRDTVYDLQSRTATMSAPYQIDVEWPEGQSKAEVVENLVFRQSNLEGGFRTKRLHRYG